MRFFAVFTSVFGKTTASKKTNFTGFTVSSVYWPSYYRLKNEKYFSGQFFVVFGLHPTGHLAENKHSILSKGKFLSLNCCFINYNHAINFQLHFNKQINSN